MGDASDRAAQHGEAPSLSQRWAQNTQAPPGGSQHGVGPQPGPHPMADQGGWAPPLHPRGPEAPPNVPAPPSSAPHPGAPQPPVPAPGAPTARIFATGLYLRQSFWSTSGMRPVILETDGRSVRLTNAEGEVFCVPGPQVSVTFKARFMILNVKGEEFQLFPRGDIASPPFTPGMMQYLDAHGGRRAMGGGTATGAMLGSAIIPGMGLATLVGTYQSLITPWKSVFPSLGVRFV